MANNIIKDIDILNKNSMPEDKMLDDINLIANTYKDYGIYYIALLAFNYGKIQGKREERNRKNREAKEII